MRVQAQRFPGVTALEQSLSEIVYRGERCWMVRPEYPRFNLISFS